MSQDFQPDWKMPLSEYARIQNESMPKIKPLVWVQVDDGGTTYGGGSAVASFTVYHSLLTGKWTCLYGAFDSLDEAKAACQQEYERRVRECLE